jgi:hypothetical protein
VTIPFTPVVYEQAARFVGRMAWEVSREAELLFVGHRREYVATHPSGQAQVDG